jgi:hypothetical protein
MGPCMAIRPRRLTGRRRMSMSGGYSSDAARRTGSKAFIPETMPCPPRSGRADWCLRKRGQRRKKQKRQVACRLLAIGRCGRKKTCRKMRQARRIWLRGQDLNLRPSGYEPDELPDCSTPRHCLQYTKVGQACQEIPAGVPSAPACRQPAIRRRSRRACARVPLSTCSSSPPTGKPRAIRETRMLRAASSSPM